MFFGEMFKNQMLFIAFGGMVVCKISAAIKLGMKDWPLGLGRNAGGLTPKTLTRRFSLSDPQVRPGGWTRRFDQEVRPGGSTRRFDRPVGHRGFDQKAEQGGSTRPKRFDRKIRPRMNLQWKSQRPLLEHILSLFTSLRQCLYALPRALFCGTLHALPPKHNKIQYFCINSGFIGHFQVPTLGPGLCAAWMAGP